MTFALANLIPIGGQSARGQGPALWSYTTTDATADMDTSGYFDSAASRLSVGDIIFAVTTSTGTPTAMNILMVQSNTGTVVDVFNAILGDTTLSDAD